MKPYYQNELTTIYNGDCLEVMDYLIEQGIKFDAIITDPPYGTTACKWDTIIPFDKMWERIKLLSYETTPTLLFSSIPFNYKVVNSNFDNYKYDWYWKKERATMFAVSNKQPMRFFEHINVFYKKQPIYNKIGERLDKVDIRKIPDNTKSLSSRNNSTTHIGKHLRYEYTTPTNFLEFNRDIGGEHPTQKPLELLQYLIKTYTKKNDLILDFTAGSFTTCVASEQLGRRSIGIELEQKYCDIGIKRLNSLQIKFDI